MSKYMFLLAFIFFSCAKEAHKISHIEVGSLLENEGQSVTSDSLTSMLGMYLEDYVKSNPAEIVETEYIKSPHNPYDSNKLSSMKINESLIKDYLYGDGKHMLVYAHINNRYPKFSPTIFLGMKKEKLSENLNNEIVNDTLTLKNQMDNYFIFFLFDEEKLNDIIFEAYPD